MKKLTLLFLLTALISAASIAQKYVYVDTKYILEQIPDYSEAQEELNKLSKEWQEEISKRYEAIEEKKKVFKAEEILLPEDTKKLRKEEIEGLEREAKDLQRQRFGVEGDLFRKRQELIQPIQEKIFKAIKQIAKDSNYGFVFDKASSSNILYAQSKLDVSDRVLRKMGYSSSN